jgi:hypothetical protein
MLIHVPTTCQVQCLYATIRVYKHNIYILFPSILLPICRPTFLFPVLFPVLFSVLFSALLYVLLSALLHVLAFLSQGLRATLESNPSYYKGSIKLKRLCCGGSAPPEEMMKWCV